MRAGDVLLLDEISLADDAVLERLNSVLEPARTLLLAERATSDLDALQVVAHDRFRIVATMNPGGDFGKRELSPALRNRFTEIWVPAISAREDIVAIVDHRWRDPTRRPLSAKLVDFASWFAGEIGAEAISLRGLLAWVDFVDACAAAEGGVPAAIVHGAHMTFVDGIGSTAETAGWQPAACDGLRERCVAMLAELVGGAVDLDGPIGADPAAVHTRVGPFAVALGPLAASTAGVVAP